MLPSIRQNFSWGCIESSIFFRYTASNSTDNYGTPRNRWNSRIDWKKQRSWGVDRVKGRNGIDKGRIGFFKWRKVLVEK